MKRGLVVLFLVGLLLAVCCVEGKRNKALKGLRMRSHAKVFHPERGAVSVHDVEQLHSFGLFKAGDFVPHTNTQPGTPPYTPAEIKAAYNFSTSPTAGAGTTVAIIDAYDNPFIEADLAAFSRIMGLPNCTSDNKCFTKVNQYGKKTPLPSYNQGWAIEIALDVQWVHSIAPGAKILLVEANSNSFADLQIAITYAKTKANYISMSFGASEFQGAGSTLQGLFSQKKGQFFFASTGDDGSGVQFPAVHPNVTAVGGTTLKNAGLSTQNETGWTGSGGGCSAYVQATQYQAAFSSYQTVGCSSNARAVPDLSSVADPYTGVYVTINGTWYQVGGTSLSAPITAAKTAASLLPLTPKNIYNNKAFTFRDITKGYNLASSAGPQHNCRKGFDLVTGRGSLIN